MVLSVVGFAALERSSHQARADLVGANRRLGEVPDDIADHAIAKYAGAAERVGKIRR
jgi:hypothetical protein